MNDYTRKLLGKDRKPDMKRLALLFLCLFTVAACSNTNMANATPTRSAAAPLSETPTATPLPSPTPTPNPQDVLDEATYDTLIGYGFVFGQKDGKNVLYQVDKQDPSKKAEIGYLDQNGLHIGSTVFGQKDDGAGKLTDDTQIKTSESSVFIVDKNSKDKATIAITETTNRLYENEGILTLTDKDGVTYIWDREHLSFVKKVEMSGDIEKPSYFKWGYENVAVMSAILAGLDKPFSADILNNFKGGWAINFEYDKTTDSSHAYLTPYGIDSRSIRWTLDDTGKPVWFTTISPKSQGNPDGIVYQSVLTQLLNPADPKNPKADETMFILATAGEWWQTPQQGSKGNYRSLFKSWYIDKDNFTQTLLPQIEIAQLQDWFGNHNWGSFPSRSSLDSLLNYKENDPGKLSLFAYPISEVEKVGLNKDNPIRAWKFGDKESLPKELQGMVLPLSFTSK